MDVLSDVLRTVRLCGSVFFSADFAAPWAVESPSPELLAAIVMPEAEHISVFHILIDGECLVQVESLTGRHLSMRSGDVVVFPDGHPHTMRSSADAAATPLEHVLSRPAPDAVARVALGGGGRRARFICGYLNCNQRFAPLLDALPAILVVRRQAEYAAVEAVGRQPTAVPSGVEHLA